MKVNRARIKALATGDMVYLGLDQGKAFIEMIIRSETPKEDDLKLRFDTRFTHEVLDRDMVLDETARGGFLLYLNPGNQWSSFVHALRPGDQIVPHFRLRNASPNMQAAGFFEDALLMKIIRDRGEDKQPLVLNYLIDTCVSQNSVLCTRALKRSA